jgi:hypothetical protein
MIIFTASLVVSLSVTGPPAAAEPSGAASITIMVDDAGTKVHNKGTTWVSVTPNGPGQTAVVAPGTRQDFAAVPDVQGAAQASATGSRTLSAPSLLYPSDKEKVKLKPTEKGPGQVTLTWTPVTGAKEYEVEFTVDNGKSILLKVPGAAAKLPPIPSGKVAWAVRSVGEGAASEQSLRRSFELQTEEIKLVVQPPTGWK